MLFSTVKTSSSLSNLCVFRIEAPNPSGEGYKILSEILELYKCLSWDENLKCIAHVASMMMVALLCANLISSLCILEARTSTISSLHFPFLPVSYKSHCNVFNYVSLMLNTLVARHALLWFHYQDLLSCQILFKGGQIPRVPFHQLFN